MSRFYGLILCCSLFCCCGCSPGIDEVHRPAEVKLRIELRTDTPVIRSGLDPRIEAHLVNDGTAPVTVVLPGDGSSTGRRTPLVRWNPPMELRPGCGNINALQANEVVTIWPGERLPLIWIHSPGLTELGTHQVSLTLENVPDLKWGGIPLGEHDPTAMERVRRTAPFKVVSNVVAVEVRK